MLICIHTCRPSVENDYTVCHMLKWLICRVFFRDTVGLAGPLALQAPLKDRCSRGQGGWCPSASSSWWTVPGHMARMDAAEPGWRTPMIMWSIKGWRALTYTPILLLWVLLYIWVSFEMFSCDSANLNVCFFGSGFIRMLSPVSTTEVQLSPGSAITDSSQLEMNRHWLMPWQPSVQSLSP